MHYFEYHEDGWVVTDGKSDVTGIQTFYDEVMAEYHSKFPVQGEIDD